MYYDPLGLEAMDWLWGGISYATGGWSPDQSTVDFGTGLGDGIFTGLSLGLLDGQDVRDFLDIDGGINKCSSAYNAGETLGFVAVISGNVAALVRGLSAKGGYVLARKSTGGYSVRAMAVRGSASRPSYELLNVRNILRVEAHPTRAWMPSGMHIPHLHIDAIPAISKIHLPFVEPIVAGKLANDLLSGDECGCQ